jgi:hypothetical protein
MCGIGQIRENNCAACSWPYSIEGWKKFSLGLRRITIDTCCINAKQKNDFLNKLGEWERAGKIEIQKASPLLEEFKGPVSHLKKAEQIDNHPPIAIFGATMLGDGSVYAGPDLIKDIQSILFPNVKTLSENQMRDIQHLREHVWTGGHIFVTIDKHFINAVKKETLRQLGVWVLTPEETVDLIRKVYNWN